MRDVVVDDYDEAIFDSTRIGSMERESKLKQSGNRFASAGQTGVPVHWMAHLGENVFVHDEMK